MKRILLSFGLLLTSVLTVCAQGYQAQYPYDPYNNNPQPTPSAYADDTPPSKNAGSPAPTDGPSPGNTAYDSLLSYGYVAVDYSFSNFSNSTTLGNGSGLKADLSVPLFKPFFLHFAVDWLSGAEPSGSTNFNMTAISAGAGAYFAIADRFHIFAEMGAQYDVVNGGPIVIGQNELAFYVKPGIRVAVTDRIEVQADITFNTTNNLNDRVYGITGYYALFSMLDVGFGVDFASDVNTYHAGLRYRW